MASAHLLAAAGGGGLLEIDTNPNPDRDAMIGNALPVSWHDPAVGGIGNRHRAGLAVALSAGCGHQGNGWS